MNMTQIKQLVDDAGGVFNAEDQHSPEHFILDADAMKAFVGFLQPKVGDDMRGEFEAWSKSLEFFDWVTTEDHAKLNFNAGYQACAQRYEAQVNALLAVIAEKNKALQCAMDVFDAIPNRAQNSDIYELKRLGLMVNQGDGCACYYPIVRDALILTPENVRLVALDGKYFNDGQSYVKIDAQYENSTDAVKLYTIEVNK